MEQNIEYFAPQSIPEALALLDRYPEKVRVVAGGTDYLVKLKKGLAPADYLINLRGLRELDYIKYDKTTGLNIGALTTLETITKSPLVREHCPVLAEAAGMVGTPTIRHQATLGGNLCNAAPSADTVPALIVSGSKATVSGLQGEKGLSLEDLFTGPGQTVIGKDQLLTVIQIPTPVTQSTAVYIKQSRIKGADLALVGVAVLVVLDGDIFKDVKVALGAVAPIPIRAKKAEVILKGQKLTNDLLEKAGQAAAAECQPIDDCRSSSAYRKKMVALQVQRALRQAAERIQAKE